MELPMMRRREVRVKSLRRKRILMRCRPKCSCMMTFVILISQEVTSTFFQAQSEAAQLSISHICPQKAGVSMAQHMLSFSFS